MSKTKGSATIIVILIGILILSLIIIYAVVGFGLGQGSLDKARNVGVGPQPPTDAQIEALNSQSSSDEIGSIEKDLSETNIDDLDGELEQVDRELQDI